MQYVILRCYFAKRACLLHMNCSINISYYIKRMDGVNKYQTSRILFDLNSVFVCRTNLYNNTHLFTYTIQRASREPDDPRRVWWACVVTARVQID